MGQVSKQRTKMKRAAKSSRVTDQPCAIQGCTRGVEVPKHGLCGPHYRRYRAEEGSAEPREDKKVMTATKASAKRGARVCQVPGCRREMRVFKHGLCRAHYRRYRASGDVRPNEPIIVMRPLKPYPG